MDHVNRDVQNNNAYLHAVLDSVVDSIISITPTGIIQTFNRSAERVFGYKAEEMIGQNIRILMPEPHQGAHDGYLANYLRTGEAKVIGVAGRELEALRKDGSVFPIDLSVNEIKTNDIHYFVGIVRDLSERKKAAQALTDHAARLESVLTTMVDGLLMIDETRIVHSFNPAAERIFGYCADEVVGQNIKMLMPEPYHSEHDTYVKNYLATGVAKIIGLGREVQGKRKDGTVFPMDLAVSEMSVTGQRMFVGLIRDISERKQAENEREKYISALQHSNQELDDFAYIASHDLKEPLRGLFNNALFMQEDAREQLDENSLKRLSRMRYLCERMEKLIDNLLYFSRIGRLDFAIQKTDMNHMIHEVIKMVESYGENVEIKMPLLLPEAVCDYTRVTEVFHNLIGNAIKYNDKEKKVIEIGFLEQYKNKTHVFYVKDNGIGIAPEFYETVFKMFKRLNEEDDKNKGNGVGLAFVKKIIERHKGEIWVESVLGQGTIFYFTLNGEIDE